MLRVAWKLCCVRKNAGLWWPEPTKLVFIFESEDGLGLNQSNITPRAPSVSVANETLELLAEMPGYVMLLGGVGTGARPRK